jgi:peptidoglycan/xylan/chitin deacetylase (PgdA/CDA1 family)
VGYVPVTWSITCYDWRRTATEAKIARRAARARDGDVILLHDGSSREPAADRAASIAATERTLERFSAEGYRFVTIPELVAPR